MHNKYCYKLLHFNVFVGSIHQWIFSYFKICKVCVYTELSMIAQWPELRTYPNYL